jgi:hypothetical protein
VEAGTQGGGAGKGALGCPWIVREPATLKLSLEPTTGVRGGRGNMGSPEYHVQVSI